MNENQKNPKKLVEEAIHQYLKNNYEKFMKSYLNTPEDEEFFIQLITLIFKFLQNKTKLLKCLKINQLKKLASIIYSIAKFELNIQGDPINENNFLMKISNIYGFVYLTTNQVNKMVYVGQTLRNIEKEWGEILKKGKTLRRKREKFPNKKFKARFILNAIASYPDNVWDLKLIDIAYSKTELDEKERYYIVEIYDSMNPKKGYNLTTGGRTGGRLSKRTKQKVSESVSNKWNTPGYKEMMCEIQKKAWKGKKGTERRKNASIAQKKAWENDQRRINMSNVHKEAWNDKQKRKIRIENLKSASRQSWQNPTEKMRESLKKMHQETKKDIIDVREFLIDIKNTKNQNEFFKGKLFRKYGIKSHVTFNTRIKEILGRFGVENHGEAHRFFYDRSINEVFKYLNNPNGYNIFKDPLTREFFIDVKESEKGRDLHVKYRVWYKQGLITKIKRIVGEFGINNYTELKWYLLDNGIDESLNYFEQMDREIS